MADERYERPAGIHRIEHMVSNSRFITTIAPVNTTEEARAFLKQIREEMPDASHHVYAFRVGYGNSVIEGMSDDGEPSGTSGPPTLAVLRGTDIGDIILVTTRYFGGTKLGTGGLVRSYSEAARLALKSLKTELKIPRTLIGIDISYSIYEQLKRSLPEFHATIEDETFTGSIALLIEIPDDDLDAFTDALQELSNGKAEPVILEKR